MSVWIDPNSHLVPTTGVDSISNDILSITLSPSEENVVCSTRTQQLYNLTLSAADLQGKVRENRNVHVYTYTCSCSYTRVYTQCIHCMYRIVEDFTLEKFSPLVMYSVLGETFRQIQN